MRATLALVAMALVATTSEAREPVAWERLPNGNVTALPATLSFPTSIPANEKVSGLAFGVEGRNARAVEGAGCFAYPLASAEIGRTSWEDALQSELYLVRDSPQHRVVLVHSERVVEEAGKTALVSLDAWVDTQTLGARLRARATLPLVPLGSAPGGARILAGREAQPNGKSLVHFVVAPPSEPLESVEIRHSVDDRSVSSSQCAHHRVALASSGDAAVIRASAVTRENYLRPLRIDLSVSQTSRDKEPVVSLSTNWTGAEKSTRDETDEE
jgi:hypothetical protein